MAGHRTTLVVVLLCTILPRLLAKGTQHPCAKCNTAEKAEQFQACKAWITGCRDGKKHPDCADLETVLKRHPECCPKGLKCEAVLKSVSGSPLLTTVGDKVVDDKGKEIQFKGIAWFGFNNPLTMVGTLNKGDGSSVTSDFKTVVYRMKALGFNTVRLAFSFYYLHDHKPIIKYRGPCKVSSQAQVVASLTSPHIKGGVQHARDLPPIPDIPGGICNADLPEESVFERFVYVVHHLVTEGFYVALDYHSNKQGDSALYYKDHWVKCWAQLVTAILKEPAAKGKLLIDLINEPDGYDLRWETVKGHGPDGKELLSLAWYYIGAIDVLYPICPDCLYLLEGTGQYMYRANWGDGFNTDLAIIAKKNISNANILFQDIWGRPWLNQVVLAPHVYCPAVSRAPDSFAGYFLFKRLSSSFGMHAHKGYCLDGVCKQFPIILGEFGTDFQDHQEYECWESLIQYMNNDGDAKDGRHTAINSWLYWSWNHDSNGTGGVVKENWRDVDWKKVHALAEGHSKTVKGLGLKPWWVADTYIDWFKQPVDVSR